MITDDILFRYLNRESTPGENREISAWLAGNPDNQARLDQLAACFNPGEMEAGQLTSLASDSGMGGRLNPQAHSWETIETRLESISRVPKRSPVLAMRIARIAAVLLLVAGSAALWMLVSNTHVLRNGESITQSVLLPDGTTVDLGPGSKLIYNNEFLQGRREVRLKGEACFDVTPDPEHPFTVMAGVARIKVTGTRFAVTAPPGTSEIEVVVKSGKVLFYNSDKLEANAFRMGLVAGEMGIFNPAQKRMDKTRDPYFQTTP